MDNEQGYCNAGLCLCQNRLSQAAGFWVKQCNILDPSSPLRCSFAPMRKEIHHANYDYRGRGQRRVRVYRPEKNLQPE